MVTYFQDTLFFNGGELTAPSTTPPVSVYENNYFSTKNYSLVATVNNIDTNVVVRLDGSIDGTHYGPIISNTITENGTFVYKASNIPVKFVRANFYKETGGTNAIVRLSFSAQ